MRPPVVRRAFASDAEAVSEILIGAARWLEERGMPQWKGDELSPENTAAEVAKGMFHVAEISGEIAGTMKFQLEDALFWPDLPEGEAAFVHRLAVRRDFAGSGVSTALLAWAVARARELGRRFVRLDCEESRPRLRAFYERFGFQHHSDREVGPYFVSRYQYPV